LLANGKVIHPFHRNRDGYLHTYGCFYYTDDANMSFTSLRCSMR
jgi:hypothetical protein